MIYSRWLGKDVGSLTTQSLLWCLPLSDPDTALVAFNDQIADSTVILTLHSDVCIERQTIPRKVMAGLTDDMKHVFMRVDGKIIQL